MKNNLAFILLFVISNVLAEDPVTSLRFVNIPGGSFLMGSKRSGYKDERPVHRVRVQSFAMMDHELTIGELKKLLRIYPTVMSRNIEKDSLADLNIQELVDNNHQEWPNNIDDMPVTVTWIEAINIATKLGEVSGKKIRLPTEVEWEYSARGGLVQKLYPWGNMNDKINGIKVASLIKRIQGKHNSAWLSLPVYSVRTTTPPNSFGLYDMAGNVWEWTSSLYRPYPYNKVDGREVLRQNGMRVIRGGGQSIESRDVRVSFRGYGSMESRYGVRYVMDTTTDTIPTKQSIGMDWTSKFHNYGTVLSVYVPNGFTVKNAPSYDALTIKEVQYTNGKIQVIGHVDVGETRFYMSKWSWEQYSRGRTPNWILIH